MPVTTYEKKDLPWKATDKQKKLCLQMIEAHWDCSTSSRELFTIYRGKGDSWSPNKRARSKVIKEFRKQILNDEWTMYTASCFISRHFDEFITLVWGLTPQKSSNY